MESTAVWSPSEWFDSGYMGKEQIVREAAESGSIVEYASLQSFNCEGVLCDSDVEKYLESVCRDVMSEEKGGVVLDAYRLLEEEVPAWGKEQLSPLYDDADMDDIFYVLDENGENVANALVFEIGSTFFVGYTDELDGWNLMSREDSKKLTLSLDLPNGNA